MIRKKAICLINFITICLCSCSSIDSFESFLKSFKEKYPGLDFRYREGLTDYKYFGDITAYNNEDEIVYKKEFTLLGKGICDGVSDILFDDASCFFAIEETESFYQDNLEVLTSTQKLAARQNKYSKFIVNTNNNELISSEKIHGEYKSAYLFMPHDLTFFLWDIEHNDEHENSNITNLDFDKEDSSYIISGEYLQNYDSVGSYETKFKTSFDFDVNFNYTSAERNYFYKTSEDDQIAKKTVNVKLELAKDLIAPVLDTDGEEKNEEIICIQRL